MLLSLLAAGLSVTAPFAQQIAEPPAPDTLLPDSAVTLSSARAAQSEFERFRQKNLPWTLGPGGSNCGDERIGRFCFWFDDDSDLDEGEAISEPVKIRARRDTLIMVLDSAQRRFPGDKWINGQLVRYLVSAKRTDDALEAVNRCRARKWWCEVLRGFILHQSNVPVEAQEAYRQAVQDMPLPRRCVWSDISYLLDSKKRKGFKRLPCSNRLRIARRFWWLADPLYMVPGNDRRTEHYVRVTYSTLLRDSRVVYGIPWGPDLDEVLIRYGVPTGWQRSLTSAPSSFFNPAIIGRNAPNSVTFIPPGSTKDELKNISDFSDEWKLDRKRGKAAYIPSYASNLFSDLNSQIAYFYRGDSTLITAAFDFTTDSGPPAAFLDASLWAIPDEKSDGVASFKSRAFPHGVITLMAPQDLDVVSLEVFAREEKVAARTRRVLDLVRPTRDFTISNLLLFKLEGDSLKTDLDSVLPKMTASSNVIPNSSVGLYWELYGLQQGGNRLNMSLELAKLKKDFYKKRKTLASLTDKKPEVKLEWVDAVEIDGAYGGRAVEVELPKLKKGFYLFTMHATDQRSGRSAIVYKVVRVPGKKKR